MLLGSEDEDRELIIRFSKIEVIIDLGQGPQSDEDQLQWSKLKSTEVEKANIAISLEMFYYAEVQRGSHGVKQDFKISNVKAGLQTEGLQLQ